MGTKTRSLVSAIALAFVVLFFGPSTPSAEAKHARLYAPHHVKHHPYQGYARHQGYARPYSGRAYAPHYRPYYPSYRMVRVFVHDPFPRWVYRRVYYAPPVVGPYCNPY